MSRRKGLLTAKWITVAGALVLGVIGYVQPITGAAWPRWSSIGLLIAFVAITIAQWVVEHLEYQRAASDFYAQEVTEVFQPADSEERIRFLTDKAGNKCVGLVLEREAIPGSVHLWEGGYYAPPITLRVSGKVVVFRHSGYDSFEQYAKGGPVYQVRYVPK